MNQSKLEKKCLQYIKEQLRAPTKTLVTKWGKHLKLSADEINQVNDRLQIRHRLGTIKKKVYVKLILIITNVQDQMLVSCLTVKRGKLVLQNHCTLLTLYRVISGFFLITKRNMDNFSAVFKHSQKQYLLVHLITQNPIP
jgi:hypothetical protein